jgi:hypothetical protein
MSKKILSGNKKKPNGPDTTNERLDAALGYAGKGWQVFPVHAVIDGRCTCGDPSCRYPGKHPRTLHGFKDATTDPKVINTWWSNWPDANVAIVTGAQSGLVVLDIDPRNRGFESLAELISMNGEIPRTLRSRTGGGGRHIFFQHPGHHVKSHTMMPGIDLKGDGGYVVAPPSIHASGERYEWEEEQ